jgi:acetyltransferase-like isoleucine patch superfamily enzyme
MSSPQSPGRLEKFRRLPFSLKIRFASFLTWGAVRGFLFRLHHLVNLLKLWASGVQYGKNLRTWGGIILNIYPGSMVVLGDDISIVSNSWRSTASVLYSRTRFRTFTPTSAILIGDHTGLNGTSITSRSREISIGAYAMIAPNVIITDSDFHIPWPPEGRRQYPGDEQDAKVTIGEHCWIGMNSIILKGADIGDNSVIAAGSVVVGSIPPNCLAGGVPARVIKTYGSENSV